MEMKLKAITRIILMLFLASISTMAFDVVHTANELPVHNIDTGLHYETIQEAINAPETLGGHTIQVDAGIYSEHVTVDKSLRLVGEDRGTTIIDASGAETVAVITANNVHISGFTIRNSGPEFHSGIYLTSCNNAMISGNIIIDNTWGIWLEYVADNVISENTIQNSEFAGIYLGDSINNSISCNTMTNTGYGAWLDRSDNNAIIGNTVTESAMGISLAINSNNNTVTGNTLNDNDEGIHLFSSFNNIFENTITSNWYGIFSLHSGGNTIYHNNFIENLMRQASLNESYVDIWDNGCEGNHWSDYDGTDADQDGIGETPYTVYGDSKDNHPLMGMFSNFTISWQEQGYSLTTICNSTISNFQFNASLRMISFDVTGELGIGFCRVTIPNILVQDLWHQDYSILLNGEPWPFRNWTDSERTHLYFVYPHSEHEVVIVPEFPSTLVLPSLVIISLIIIAVRIKKRHI